MSDVTNVLSQIEKGDALAAEQLLPLVYDELRKLAAVKLAHEKPGQTLQATALVHEAYLRLVGGPAGRDSKPGVGENDASNSAPVASPQPSAPIAWTSRGHFFGAAAEAMRRILIENARRKAQVRRGGNRQRVDLDEAEAVSRITPDELLAVDEALEVLEEQDADAAQVFKLCYFTGCSVEASAELLGISRATAYRHWTFARAWLLSQLQHGA